MKIEWLFEAQGEFRDYLLYYRNRVGEKYAREFAARVLSAVGQLQECPEIGVLWRDTLMGKYSFCALFVEQYVCIYRIEGETVYIYHLTDARKNIFTIYSGWNEKLGVAQRPPRKS